MRIIRAASVSIPLRSCSIGVLGVHHVHLKPVLFQNLIQGHPVDSGGLHHDRVDLARRKPSGDEERHVVVGMVHAADRSVNANSHARSELQIFVEEDTGSRG